MGAYADIADRVVTKGNYLAAGPYKVPAVRIIARGVLSNTPPATAMRGFGVPETAWAREMNLDDCALALGIDRLEIRLRNLAHYGEEFVAGDTPADGRWEQTVQRAAELIDWGKPLPPHCGRGIAVAAKSGPTTGLSYSTVRLPGRRQRHGVLAAPRTWARGPARCSPRSPPRNWACPVEKVTTVMSDTAVVPFDQQTSASRSTVIMGTAVLNACRDIQAQLRAVASRLHGVEESAVTVDRGVVRLPDRELTVVEVAKAGLRQVRAASGSATASAARTAPPATRSRARRTSTSSTARPSRCRWTRGPGRSPSCAT